jgi:hypothetical protein
VTHRRGFGIGLVFSAALSLASARPLLAADGASPFIGQWHWNASLSKLPPGEPAPTEMTLQFDRVDSAHVRWTVMVKDASGRPAMESHDTPGNGEFYPISEDTTASFRLLGPDRLGASFKGPAGEDDSMTCTVSADHRQMTCDGAKTVGGKTAHYVDVYDRG